MKRLLHLGGTLLSLLCLGYVVIAIAGHWRAVSMPLWSGVAVTATVVALVLYVSTYAVASLGWQAALRLYGCDVPYRVAARILMLSQLAKYLPGNVGHHIGRVVLAQKAQLPPERVIPSMLAETLTVLLAAALASLPVLGTAYHVLTPGGEIGRGTWLALGVLLLAGVLGLASVRLRRLLRGLIPQAPVRGSARLLTRMVVCHALNFAIGALALQAICAGLDRAASPSWPDLLGIYAAAWLLGFLVPGSPAGLGVREVVLLWGLSSQVPGVATVAVALLRLVTSAGDGLAFLVGGQLSKPARKATFTPP